jgi:hypothetical protein
MGPPDGWDAAGWVAVGEVVAGAEAAALTEGATVAAIIKPTAAKKSHRTDMVHLIISGQE